jgi:hypothetical protein
LYADDAAGGHPTCKQIPMRWFVKIISSFTSSLSLPLFG